MHIVVRNCNARHFSTCVFPLHGGFHPLFPEWLSESSCLSLSLCRFLSFVLSLCDTRIFLCVCRSRARVLALCFCLYCDIEIPKTGAVSKVLSPSLSLCLTPPIII